jgi:hypothetical protein
MRADRVKISNAGKERAICYLLDMLYMLGIEKAGPNYVRTVTMENYILRYTTCSQKKIRY